MELTFSRQAQQLIGANKAVTIIGVLMSDATNLSFTRNSISRSDRLLQWLPIACWRSILSVTQC